MYKFIYNLMLILAAITSFEELILKFLPVPDKIYFYSRFLTEILLYIAFSLVIFSKLLKRIPLSRTPLDLPIILFVVSAILSTLVNHSPIFGSIVSLRPLLRFIPLFYLTVNLNITFNQARKISRTIIFAGTVQVAIGILQFLSRGALDSLLLPRATDTEIGGVSKTYILVKTGREIGSIYGAAGDTVTYAVFLIVIFILIISKLHTQYFNNLNKDEFTIKKYSKKTRFIARILIGFLFINISLTYVRATLFAVIILGMVHSFKAFGRVRTTIGLSVAMALVIIIFAAIPPQFIGSEKVKQRSVFADITGVFTPEYIRIAKKQRLGALIGIVPTVIFNKPILGYGADLSSTIDELNASKISFLTKVWTEEGFKDVYWVTILAFYGLAGLSSMVWMFWRLYYCAAMIYKVSQEQITKETSLAVTYIAMITVFLLFFNQTIEFRIYSFYLWLLSGLMFSLYFQEKKKTDNFLKEE